MTEQQANRAMELLARLYADQMGYDNPKITVRKREVNEKSNSNN